MFQLRDQFVLDLLPTLDSDSLRVCLALLPLPPRGGTLTPVDLAFRAGISPSRLDFTLKALTGRGILSEPAKLGNGEQRFTFTPVVDDRARTFRLVPAQDDPRVTIESLLQEKAHLTARLRRHSDDSGLADKISSADVAAVARLAEEMLGRALTIDEAFALGEMIEGYGPRRVTAVLGNNKNHSNPIVGSIIMLRKGARGKPFEKKDAPKPIAYFSPSDDFHPFH